MTERAIDIIRRASKGERKSINVPEWEGLTLWFNKLTTSDIQGIAEREPKNAIERNMYLVQAKAQNEDGSPAFAAGDMHFLKTEADFLIVQRLVDFMYQSAAGEVKDAEAEIKANPTSAPDSTLPTS